MKSTSESTLALPRLEELQSFLALAELLHFTAAADELGIPQTVVTRHIQRLEEFFGVVLFARTTRKVSLSDAGKSLQQSARRMVHELEAARERLDAVDSGQVGSLHFGYVASAAVALMPAALREFRHRFSQIRLGLLEGFDDDLISKVRHGELDVAITRSSNVRNDLRSQAIGEADAICAVFPSDHPLAKRKRVSIEQLRKSGMIIWPRSLDVIDRNMMETSFSRRGFDITFDNEEVSALTVVSLAAMGAGVGMLAEQFTALSWPGVVFIPITGRWSQLHAVWRADDERQLIRNFLDVLGVIPVGAT